MREDGIECWDVELYIRLRALYFIQRFHLLWTDRLIYYKFLTYFVTSTMLSIWIRWLFIRSYSYSTITSIKVLGKILLGWMKVILTYDFFMVAADLLKLLLLRLLIPLRVCWRSVQLKVGIFMHHLKLVARSWISFEAITVCTILIHFIATYGCSRWFLELLLSSTTTTTTSTTRRSNTIINKITNVFKIVS